MDGVHDLGGMEGFGPIEREHDEPMFHEGWQRTAFALMMASQALIRNNNADEYRHAVERIPPQQYLGVHYYERVFTGTVSLLVERGLLDHDELAERAGGRFPLAVPVADNPVIHTTPHPDPRFSVGDIVRVDHRGPRGHTRVPRFCRGRQGTVIRVAPPFRFPDTRAHDGPRRSEHTYHVEFTAQELWGDQSHPQDTVVVDLWDSYLEKAQS